MSTFKLTQAERAAAAIRVAIRRAAKELGATIVHEPVEGYEPLTRPRLDDPLLGVRAARLARNVAIRQMREYAEVARGAGSSWDDIAAALGIEPGADGEPRDEQAYSLIIERRPLPSDEQSIWWQRPVARWTCGSCGQRITDTGPFERSQRDSETGHDARCPRA